MSVLWVVEKEQRSGSGSVSDLEMPPQPTLKAVGYPRIKAALLLPSASDHRVQMEPVPTGERSAQSLQRGAALPWQENYPSRFVSLFHSIKIEYASSRARAISPKMEAGFTLPCHGGADSSSPPGPLAPRCPLTSPVGKEKDPTPSHGKTWPCPSCASAVKRS